MTAKIASVYFAPVKAERIFGGVYQIPAVGPGKEPLILTITDRVQVEQGPYSLGSVAGRRSVRRQLIPGEAIARDLVREWTEMGLGMTPQCRPGIWMVREQVALMREDGTIETDADGLPLWRLAMDEERELMWEQDLQMARMVDRAYADYLFMQANALAEDARLIPFVSEVAKTGARAYGLEAEWLKANAALNVKTCSYCTKVIPGAAIKCPHCQEIVDVEAYARLEATKKQALKVASEAAARLQKEGQLAAV